jgi:hypothetical protein
MATNAELDEQAQKIREAAAARNLKVAAHSGIVTVWGNFTPGDQMAFMEMESDAYHVLNMFRQVRAGSTWGTDSGTVGGALAVQDGLLRLNRSGIEKRMLQRFYK